MCGLPETVTSGARIGYARAVFRRHRLRDFLTSRPIRRPANSIAARGWVGVGGSSPSIGRACRLHSGIPSPSVLRESYSWRWERGDGAGGDVRNMSAMPVLGVLAVTAVRRRLCRSRREFACPCAELPAILYWAMRVRCDYLFAFPPALTHRAGPVRVRF
jgi:hypothetical protein